LAVLLLLLAVEVSLPEPLPLWPLEPLCVLEPYPLDPLVP
jgi:hypothetical protein